MALAPQDGRITHNADGFPVIRSLPHTQPITSQRQRGKTNVLLVDKIFQGASFFFSFYIPRSKKKTGIRVTPYSEVMLMYLQTRKKRKKQDLKNCNCNQRTSGFSTWNVHCGIIKQSLSFHHRHQSPHSREICH